jgi:hypothetical protein
MNGRTLIVLLATAIGLSFGNGLASATETFDCSINHDKWELMAHASVDGEIRDVILFISENEKYIYYPAEGQVQFNNRAHRFTLKIEPTPEGQPGLDIIVTDDEAKAIFRGQEYDIKCTWIPE